MEHRRFELLASSMPWKRATNCANAPKASPRYPIDPPSGNSPGRLGDVTQPSDIKPLHLKRIVLKASDDGAHLYEQFGWHAVDKPEAWMELRSAGAV